MLSDSWNNGISVAEGTGWPFYWDDLYIFPSMYPSIYILGWSPVFLFGEASIPFCVFLDLSLILAFNDYLHNCFLLFLVPGWLYLKTIFGMDSSIVQNWEAHWRNRLHVFWKGKIPFTIIVSAHIVFFNVIHLEIVDIESVGNHIFALKRYTIF